MRRQWGPGMNHSDSKWSTMTKVKTRMYRTLCHLLVCRMYSRFVKQAALYVKSVRAVLHILYGIGASNWSHLVG